MAQDSRPFPRKDRQIRRAERLFRLVNEMRSRRVSRADDLAAELEVSPRTIYRDIAHLQASGLPIEGEAGIGYLLRPGFDLPSTTFTHDQIEALAVGLAFAERAGDPALATAAREARAKIQAGLPQPEARILADAPYFSLHPGMPAHVRTVRQAVRNRQVVFLAYADGAGQASLRRVRPLAVWSFPEGWMFTGWCELRQDFRSFRFDRVASLVCTPDLFADEEATSLAAFLARENCEGPALRAADPPDMKLPRTVKGS